VGGDLEDVARRLQGKIGDALRMPQHARRLKVRRKDSASRTSSRCSPARRSTGHSRIAHRLRRRRRAIVAPRRPRCRALAEQPERRRRRLP
jgi:hypothetical protein